MPKRMLTCKVCGKKFEACVNTYPIKDAFNWRDIACSIECGQEYFRRVEEARSDKPRVTKTATTKQKRDVVKKSKSMASETT